MKRFRRKKLPPPPTGAELLDLIWASQTPLAPYLLSDEPSGVDPAWATAKGIRGFWLLVQAYDQAKAELDRTPEASTLRQLRQRRLKRLAAQSGECAGLIFAALADAARSANRKASTGQIWVLVFEGFKALANANREELSQWKLP
jgi:hypothetical protein